MGVMINKKSTQKTKFEESGIFLERTDPPSSLEEQLLSLYSDKKRLQDELGVSDPESIIRMVRSMEAQLHTFYAQLDSSSLS